MGSTARKAALLDAQPNIFEKTQVLACAPSIDIGPVRTKKNIMRSGIFEESHEAEVHVQLLMAVK
jgi:hypothetical protein